MSQAWRFRILLLLLFGGITLLSWYLWKQTRDQVSQLVGKVESGTRPDAQLIVIKELWNTFSHTAASIKVYQSSSDEGILAGFIDQKDSIQSVIDTLAINATGAQKEILNRLSEIVTAKAQLYHDLAEINYNRRVMQSIDRISKLEPNMDSVNVQAEEGNFFQRMFSSRYSRKSLQARTDSILNERNLRMEEYKRNIRKVREEEERLFLEQQEKESDLLRHDQELSSEAADLIVALETAERNRIASIADELRLQTRESGEMLQRVLLIGLIAVILLLSVVLIEIEIAGRRKKQLSEARARAEKLALAREEFMATMSHEIRTPLTAVIGFSEKLKQEAQGLETAKTASAILGSSRHLLAIVNDVLDFTRIESGKLRFSQESFRVDAVFAEVAEALSWKANEKNIDLSLFAQPVAGAELHGDPVRLKQVLYNLTGNAIKFTDKGGVTITATLVDEQHHPVLIFKVSDTGCGIPAEKLNSIFEEYEQADPHSESGRSGTGLGLAISRRIVHQLGGTIEVESQPGLGSVFKVRIPYQWGEGQFSEQSFTEEPDAALLRGRHVLIAEDDPLISELVLHYLNSSGADCEAVADGESALQKLISKKYHLLIIDRQLPAMNGPDVLIALQKSHDALSQHVPVMLMTAHIRQEDFSLLENGQVAGLMAKPFTGNDLISKVKEILDKLPQTEPRSVETAESMELPKETAKPYDLSELFRASAGDTAYVVKMLNLFLTSTYASVNNLKFHLKTGNTEQIGKTAHKMLGSIRQLGMEELADHLKELELICEKDYEPDKAGILIKKLEDKLIHINAMLKKEVLILKQSSGNA